MITGFAHTAEVSAAMNLSPMGVNQLVARAEAVDTRRPKVAALLAAGTTDWPTVQVIIARTELVSDSLIARLDQSLADRIGRWQCWSRRRLINAVDAAVRTIDPMPACRSADVDHTIPFNHPDPAAGGLTVPWDLACYCREHYRLKTFHGGPGGWTDQQLPDGPVVGTAA
jgi:Domain of unknown function (DUF222)